MLRLLLVSICVFVQAGCGKTLIICQAPDRSATVRVKEFCVFPDCVVDVTLQTGFWKEASIARKTDCYVNFAHVAWTPDSKIAAVFVDNGACSSIHIAYDVKRAAEAPFEPYADHVRRSIIREYGVGPGELVPYGGDPLEWAHYPGDGMPRPGPEAFRLKYGPERWP